MAKPKIYVTRQIFDEAVDRLKEATDMKYWDSEMPPPGTCFFGRSRI